MEDDFSSISTESFPFGIEQINMLKKHRRNMKRLANSGLGRARLYVGNGVCREHFDRELRLVDKCLEGVKRSIV